MASSNLLSFQTELESMICGECGICWAMPPRFLEVRREDGATFYCPSGHPRAYVDNEVKRLEKALANERMLKETERRWREATEASAAALRGQVTKLKRRVAAGVCPCCGRTFSALARHMKAKHPDYGNA